MIFNEIFSIYYSTVAKIISAALEKPVTDRDIEKIVMENAFSESVLTISPALKTGQWQLLDKNGSTAIENIPLTPVTDMEKRWLKAISLDRRIQLFDIQFTGLEDVKPLFTPEDYFVFDSYMDGDNYSDERYIENFRLIADAVKNRYPLYIRLLNRNENTVSFSLIPDKLEYSEKDDKFRLIAEGGVIINLGRIVSCRKHTGDFRPFINKYEYSCRQVTIELTDERNALERVLLHFAHFEKQAEKISDKTYRITITYDSEDETEIVIRILSFGPFVKVVSPQHFVNLIVSRLKQQKKLDI
ncbi:MAG: WYL domain-containing protein [Oscillospiraceae bacterium]|nr:WYL domain-containing protein [Oscillospiraceae bacterium]